MTPAARIAVIEILTEMQVSHAGTLRGRRAGNGGCRVPTSALRVRATGRLLVIFLENPARYCSYWLAPCQFQCANSPRNMVLAALVLIERRTAELPYLFSGVLHMRAPSKCS